MSSATATRTHSKPTQAQRVYFHLIEFGSITTLEAFRDYGITRLSARIYELREKGHKIGGDFIERKNRFGEAVKFKRYRLQPKNKPSNG